MVKSMRLVCLCVCVCVYVPWLFNNNWALLCNMSWVHLKTRFIVVKSNTAEKYVTLLEDDLLCQNVNVSGQMLYNIAMYF